MGNRTFRALLKLNIFTFIASTSFFVSTAFSESTTFGSAAGTTGSNGCGIGEYYDMYAKKCMRAAFTAGSNSKTKDQRRSATTIPPTSSSVCSASMSIGTRCQCPFDISELSFVGEKFGGENFCVKASNDNEARDVCTRAGYNYLNPGNPDYLSSQLSARRGTQDSNKLNFYYCYRGLKKKDLCFTASYKEQNKKLKLHWVDTGNAIHKDGTCQCDMDGDSRMEDCSQAEAPQATDEKKCKDHEIADANGACVCEDGYQFDSGNSQTRVCVQKQTTASGDYDTELVNCIQPFETRAKSCESSATQAKQTCDQQNKQNPQVNDAMNATGIVSDMFQKQNQGSGMVSECLKAGAMARSPSIILGAMKETCDADYQKCNEDCGGEEEIQKYIKQCGDIAEKVAQAAMKLPGATTPDKNKNVLYFKERLAVIQSGQENGTKVCKQDATSNRSIFSEVLSGLGEAYTKAQACACQAASTVLTGVPCNSLPTAAQCLANPSLVGCAPVVSVDICSPGSQNYSYQGCKCQQDPKAQGCPQYVAANPGLNGFAGMDIKNDSGGNTSSFGSPVSPASSLSASDLNLNGNTASELASGNKSGAIGTGFNGSVGGGGGGGMSGLPGDGPEGNPAGAGEDGEGKNSGGAFGFVKSIAGSLFGSGAKKNEAGPKGGTLGSKFDPNKYRPFRGVAQEYGTGFKNDELWQLMHNGYEPILPTFIPNP